MSRVKAHIYLDGQYPSPPHYLGQMSKLGCFGFGVHLVHCLLFVRWFVVMGSGGGLQCLHLGLEAAQTEGVVRMLRTCGGLGAHDAVQLQPMHLLLQLQSLRKVKTFYCHRINLSYQDNTSPFQRKTGGM